MKLILVLFPINLYLYIFQLEGYDIFRFLKWISKNLFVRNLSSKRSLIFTLKARLILILSLTFTFLIFFYVLLVFQNTPLALVILAFFILQPYLTLITARVALFPLEMLVTQVNIVKTRNKIKSFPKLKVVAITGSYGKTSVKEILYQLIKDKYKTLRTSESYNTILGISKVVDYELDDSYDFFICEIAAYHKGDIKNLCRMVPPKYAILTGITSQHLERFGNLENIIKTKFEIYDSLTDKNNILFNLHDKNVADTIQSLGVAKAKGYLEAENIRFVKGGTNFEIKYNGKKYRIQTNLFGRSNIVNLTGAISAALELGVSINEIMDKTKYLIPIANRFTANQYHRATIIDNTFSSNEESFKEMLETAKLVHGTKVLITPGLVELGKYESAINANLGQLSRNIFDKIILVGENNRTRSFAQGLTIEPDFIRDTRKDYFEKIEDLSKTYDWIFLENDVTENY